VRTFADVNNGEPVVVRNIAAAPVGTAAAIAARIALPTPFTFVGGALLDLSPYFSVLVAPVIHAPLLPPVAP
jgi:hypothetical protein